jgi:thiamine biosynthesis protein ThiS
MTVTLCINGSEKTFEKDTAPATLAELLAQMHIDEATVVAEVDGAIVPRDAFGQTSLADGMILELVRFVPGG